MKINWDKIEKEFIEDWGNKNNGWLILPNIVQWFKDKLTKKHRSLSQNNALHLWLTQIAEILNESGQVYTNEMGIPCTYTMELLKNTYWKPLQKQLFDIESTKEMTSTILNNLIDSFTLWLSESKGVEAPEFPNKQRLMFELDKKNIID